MNSHKRSSRKHLPSKLQKFSINWKKEEKVKKELSSILQDKIQCSCSCIWCWLVYWVCTVPAGVRGVWAMMFGSIKHNPHSNQFLSSMTWPPRNRISVHALILSRDTVQRTAVQEEGTNLWEVSQISFLIHGQLAKTSKEQGEVSKPAMLHRSSHVPQYHSSVFREENWELHVKFSFYRFTNTYWYHITKD